MKLYTMIGLPGSGKSTFSAKHPEMTVVSTDAIREELFGSAEDQSDPVLVFQTAYQRIREALARGRNVIFDATNTQARCRADIFKEVPDAFHVAVVMDVPAEICKARNAARSRVVPEEVIDFMASRFEFPSRREGFNKIIIVKEKKHETDE